MLTFGIARNFGADHTRGVVVILRAVNAPDGPLVEKLDFERTG